MTIDGDAATEEKIAEVGFVSPTLDDTKRESTEVVV